MTISRPNFRSIYVCKWYVHIYRKKRANQKLDRIKEGMQSIKTCKSFSTHDDGLTGMMVMMSNR